MPVRVELLDEAVTDLMKLAEGGNLRLFLKKLVEIENNGATAGSPLGKHLMGWRKITVGNRNWRIVFRVNTATNVATVCVIGDREDEECYHEASRRAKEVANGDTDTVSLAEGMLELVGNRKARRRARAAAPNN
jgi:mRNA interferase RelE/StbE